MIIHDIDVQWICILYTLKIDNQITESVTNQILDHFDIGMDTCKLGVWLIFIP